MTRAHNITKPRQDLRLSPAAEMLLMLGHCFFFLLFTAATCAAEPQGYACPPAWPRDRACFREQTIYFRSGSPLLSAEAERHVAEVARFLKSHPSAVVAIEGYCDDRGPEEYNRALGQRRAVVASKELVQLGVAPERIDTISFGKDHPADSGKRQAREKNRRVEFVLLTPPKP